VKLDVHTRQIHVVRGILCYAWEGYDAGGGVIESREITKWTYELVGTIVLERFITLPEVRDELICLLWQAVVGTSRLPLTSLEAPLPAFVLGQLYYLYRADAGDGPVTSWEDGLQFGMQARIARHELVKLVEFTLRRVAVDELPRVVAVFQADWPGLLRSLFNSRPTGRACCDHYSTRCRCPRIPILSPRRWRWRSKCWRINRENTLSF
jgi:hypothetical protein